jgi:hypothetical protein
VSDEAGLKTTLKKVRSPEEPIGTLQAPMKRILIFIILATSAMLAQNNTPATQVYGQIPAGTIDGINANFTIPYAPAIPGSLILFRNGIRQMSGVDYNLSRNIISFMPGSIPQPGDQLEADYLAAGSGASIASTQVMADWNATSGLAQILNKPTLGTAAAQNISAFDAAGAASALLSSSNTWTGSETVIGSRVLFQITNTGNGYNAGYRYTGKTSSGSPQSAGLYFQPSDTPTSRIVGLSVNDINYQLQTDVNGNTTVTGSINATGYEVGGVTGVSGTITIPKLTSMGSNGSITVTNGIITAFTNPN